MMFEKFIQFFRKQRALESYVDDLPYLLKEKYGKKKHYSHSQIRKVIEKEGLNKYWSDYAYAKFMTESDYLRLRIKLNYHDARRRIFSISSVRYKDPISRDVMYGAGVFSGTPSGNYGGKL